MQDENLDDHAIVIKYAGDGSRLWTRSLAGEPYAVGVVTRADDSVVVATETRLFALTSTGEITYSGPSSEGFVFQRNGLGISAEGSIGFAANILGTARRGVGGVLHDDLTVAWLREVDDLAAKTVSRTISADLAGNWLLGGTVVVETIDQGDAGIREIYGGFLRKYDANGELLWSRAIPSPDDNYGYHLTAVRPNAVNEPVTLGILTNSGAVDAPNMVITTFDEAGQLIDQNTLPSSDAAVYGRDLVVTPEGDRIVAGIRFPGHPLTAYGFVSRYSSAGDMKWDYRNALIPARAADFAALRADVQGDLFAVGYQVLEEAPRAKILVCKIRRKSAHPRSLDNSYQEREYNHVSAQLLPGSSCWCLMPFGRGQMYPTVSLWTAITRRTMAIMIARTAAGNGHSRPRSSRGRVRDRR
ncbi:MAG TPA: hypothetical protein VIK91_22930 [Nannocystis sp.]